MKYVCILNKIVLYLYQQKNKIVMQSKLFKKSETGVFKLTFPTGETAYTQTKQTFTEASTLAKCTKTAEACIKRDKPTKIYSKLIEFKDEVKIEFVGSKTTASEATALKNSLIRLDNNSVDRGNSNNRIGGNNSRVVVHKRNSLTLNGDTYVSASRVDTYPLLKNKYSTHDSISHPTKGRFFKITANHIERR